MKEYLLGFWNKFKSGTIKFKIFICSIIILYIGILGITLIQFEVDSTLPGTITNVSEVIDIKSENESGKIYTVSVYSHSKMSLLQYWLVKLDKNSEVEKGKSTTLEIFTENEEYASNVGYKEQSIQDSLIVAYTEAKKNGYDVTLDYNYKGQYLINIPQNLFRTGSEDFKNSDIVTGFNDTLFTSEEDYLLSLDTIFSGISYEGKTIKEYKDNNNFSFYDLEGNRNDENINLVINLINYVSTLESNHSFNIIRNKEEKVITPSVKMLFYLYSNIICKNKNNSNEHSLYTIAESYFTSYTINYDNCNPKINITKSDAGGPSGGLMQTLAIYNSITNDDITKGKFILGTGGINLKGEATIIGGVQQKVVTAHLYEADIFFVPKENYESAKEKYDTLDTKLQLVSVETFNDVINYLNNMEVNNG